MPPKKKAGGKDKKKGAGDEDEITPEQKVQKYERHIEALERCLMIRTEQSMRARAEQEELASKVKQLHDDFSREKDDRFHISADMTRQYKAMQEELIGRINLLENTIANLRDELELSRIALEQQKKEKDLMIAMKDKEIAEQKQKMEDMAIEFGEMLKETLEKMSQRIDTSGQQFNSEAAQQFVKDQLKDLQPPAGMAAGGATPAK